MREREIRTLLILKEKTLTEFMVRKRKAFTSSQRAMCAVLELKKLETKVCNKCLFCFQWSPVVCKGHIRTLRFNHGDMTTFLTSSNSHKVLPNTHIFVSCRLRISCFATITFRSHCSLYRAALRLLNVNQIEKSFHPLQLVETMQTFPTRIYTAHFFPRVMNTIAYGWETRYLIITVFRVV